MVKLRILVVLAIVFTLAAYGTSVMTRPGKILVSEPPDAGATRASMAIQTGSALPNPAAPTQGAALPTLPVALTPCVGALAATPAETEGPFYKGNTPEKTSLVEPGMAGTKIILSGYVRTRECRPIAHALLDFWQADANGAYDNASYRLRGHLFSDTAGRYALETILPGLYPGRTRHIHVKVTAPNQPTLTTQVYFPNEARNQSDPIFDRALLATMQETPSGLFATFDFVLNVR